MINWLFINSGIVVHIVEQDATPTKDDCPVRYDTVAQDDSKTFVIGEEFTSEKQIEYNRAIWTEKGWITDVTISTLTPAFIEKDGVRYVRQDVVKYVRQDVVP
jgi:hypothetical protein